MSTAAARGSRARSRGLERGFRWLCAGAALLPIAALLVWLLEVAWIGLAQLDAPLWADALGPGLLASAKLIALTAAVALPLGVAAAIYLEEYGVERYGDRPLLGRLIERNVEQLAGVPSVLYGLIGFELFVRGLGLGGLLAGALTLALVIVPLVIIAAREALRAVPPSLREVGLALGASRWQVVRQVVLPLAWPGMLAGAIGAVARAFGEAAPLLLIAALGFAGVASPASPDSPAAALPVQIFALLSEPEAARAEAAAGVVVLMLVVLALNTAAIVSRSRGRR